MFTNICLWLTIIGALNWGLVGFFNFNLVGLIFGGDTSAFARIIYAIVGLAAIWVAYDAIRDYYLM